MLYRRGNLNLGCSWLKVWGKLLENFNRRVIVVSANMGCDHCQQRVSQLISKMNGVEDCVVDVGKGQVTMRGLISNNKKKMMKKKKKDRGIIISGSNKETIIEGLTATRISIAAARERIRRSSIDINSSLNFVTILHLSAAAIAEETS
ncbi:hypothetical protein C5167_049867 [Papaver somniferum]|uniref:HMA domain-containing protein n=1 Tax=Papaver somniferum TaxID=3469 RepID=A0A4Y7KNF9_PAPSO|nr:hypothetical protein C5167_049867 [Papaver somniferum]